jgi:hypothetical protein
MGPPRAAAVLPQEDAEGHGDCGEEEAAPGVCTFGTAHEDAAGLQMGRDRV